MKKVLFTHSYFYRFDPKQWNTQMPYPPYGTIYAAAAVREMGYEVALFDTNLRESPNEILPIIKKEKPDFLVIYDDGFNYLTKMCLTKMREAAFRLCEIGKEHGCTVMVCSSDSTDHFEKYLEQGADYVLLGEGEETLKDLLVKINSENFTPENIPGIVWQSEGAPQKNNRRPVLRDLDTLPDPAWDLVDIPSYKKIWMEAHGYFSLNFATTRGCPYKCNWCAKPIYGNRYNSRSPERVAKEIEYLINEYDVHYFWVCDDIFGLKPGWVQKFRDEVKKRNLNFKYKIQSRVDLLLKEDTIQALKDSGLDIVWVGAESGSQKILDAMDKGTKVEQIYEAGKKLKAQEIKMGFFLQFGYLEENWEDILLTKKMLLDIMPDDIGVSVSYPLPGTLFYDRVKTLMKEKQNWTDSDDLDMMYPATFPPTFYKQLHRWIHCLFRRKQGTTALQHLLRNPQDINPFLIKKIASLAYYAPAAILKKPQHKLAR